MHWKREAVGYNHYQILWVVCNLYKICWRILVYILDSYLPLHPPMYCLKFQDIIYFEEIVHNPISFEEKHLSSISTWESQKCQWK